MKFVSMMRGAAAAAVVLTSAGLAQAQDFGVSPNEGAIGQEITLTADVEDAFGPRRGKVTLTLDNGKRRRVPSAKIVSWDANTVVFTIHKTLAGFNSIALKPRVRGASILTTNENFDVLGPQLTGRDGDRFFKGDTLTLSGENFGTVKGKVSLTPAVLMKRRGSRRPRVLDWTNTTVMVKLPTLGPDGLYNISLTNFAGETSSMSPIELVTAPKPIRGKDRIVGAIGGKYSAVKGTAGDQAHWVQVAPNSLELFGIDGRVGVGGSNIRTLSIILDPQADVSEIVVPRTFIRSEVGTIIYSKAVVGRRGSKLTNYALDKEKDYSVRIDNVEDGRMSGSFSATLVKTGDDPGPGPAVIRVRGTFVLNSIVPLTR